MIPLHDLKSRVYRQVVQGSLAALAIALLIILTIATPAQADWLETLRRIIEGDPDSQASNRNRGAATRDETCLLDDGVARAVDSSSPDGSVGPFAPAAAKPGNSQIVVLAPDIFQNTIQPTPELFLYVPFDRNTYNMVLVFELAIKETAPAREVIGEPIHLSLPVEPGLMRFRLPAETPLEIGKTYEWTFRLSCRGNQPTPDSEPNNVSSTASLGDGDIDIQEIKILALGGDIDGPNVAASPTLTVRQEVFGDIQRVDETGELTEALANSDSSNRYQVYFDHDIWFDMVAALAKNPSSEWTALLKEEFNLADIDPTPQPLTPASLH